MYTITRDVQTGAYRANDGVEWYVRKFRLETQEAESTDVPEREETQPSRGRHLLLGFVSSLLGLSGLLLLATYVLVD